MNVGIEWAKAYTTCHGAESAEIATARPTQHALCLTVSAEATAQKTQWIEVEHAVAEQPSGRSSTSAPPGAGPISWRWV